jgi:hypothetical protein
MHCKISNLKIYLLQVLDKKMDKLSNKQIVDRLIAKFNAILDVLERHMDEPDCEHTFKLVMKELKVELAKVIF